MITKEEVHNALWPSESAFTEAPLALGRFDSISQKVYDFLMANPDFDPRQPVEVKADTLVDAFIEVGLVSSRGEARRLAKQNGLALNEIKVKEVDIPIESGVHLLQVGKKKHQWISVNG